MERINSIERLKKECAGDGGDFFLALGNGCIKSSKWIRWFEEDNLFSVYNEIDGRVQELTEAQIMNEEYTVIGEALKKGVLFKC